MAAKRVEFIRHCLELVNTPYIWGGKDIQGIDCSGLVTVSFFRAGGTDWRQTYNTDTLWSKLPEVAAPTEMIPGDLVFYGGDPNNPRDVDHVAVWLNGLQMIVEAAGGDHTTTSVSEAMRRRARVRITESYLLRKDFRGFRRLALS